MAWKHSNATSTGTIEGFYLAQAAQALSTGSSNAVDVLKRLQVRATLADLAVQGKQYGLDAIRVHQPLIAAMAEEPYRVLHLRFRQYPSFTLVVELQPDGQ